jgi:hypothetical protein
MVRIIRFSMLGKEPDSYPQDFGGQLMLVDQSMMFYV